MALSEFRGWRGGDWGRRGWEDKRGSEGASDPPGKLCKSAQLEYEEEWGGRGWRRGGGEAANEI